MDAYLTKKEWRIASQGDDDCVRGELARVGKDTPNPVTVAEQSANGDAVSEFDASGLPYATRRAPAI